MFLGQRLGECFSLENHNNITDDWMITGTGQWWAYDDNGDDDYDNDDNSNDDNDDYHNHNDDYDNDDNSDE